MRTADLVSFLDGYLDSKSFHDASLNGLQVQGREETFSLAVACTASLNAIEAAVNDGCDTLLVHHGLIWKGQQGIYAGPLKERLQLLFDNDVNLIAYHLPLDGHRELGNNRCLMDVAGVDGFDFAIPGDPTSIAMKGEFKDGIEASALARRLSSGLEACVRVIAGSAHTRIHRIAVCSGSGSFLLDENAAPDFDALITGDCAEQTWHLANELGITVFVTGHDASENGGIMRLGELCSEKFKLELLSIQEDPEICDDFYEFAKEEPEA